MGSLILHCWWKTAHCLGHVSRAPGWRGPDFISFTNKITEKKKKKKRFRTDICIWLTTSSCYRVRMLKKTQDNDHLPAPLFLRRRTDSLSTPVKKGRALQGGHRLPETSLPVWSLLVGGFEIRSRSTTRGSRFQRVSSHTV